MKIRRQLLIWLICLGISPITINGATHKVDILEGFINGELSNILFSKEPSGKLVLAPSINGLESTPLNIVALPIPISHSGSFQIGERLYMFGGYLTGNTLHNGVYSIALNHLGPIGSWRSETNLPMGLSDPSVMFSNGKIIVVPSKGGDNILSVSINEIDYTLGSWTSIGTLPVGIRENKSVVLGRRILLVASDDTGRTFSASILPSGKLGNWRAENTLPSEVSGFQLVSNADHVYLLGGLNNSGSTTPQVYSLSSSPLGEITPWNPDTNLPIGLSNHSATISGNCLMISGGVTGSTLSDSIFSVNIKSDGKLMQWDKQFIKLKYPIKNHSSVFSNNCFMIFGGETDSSKNDRLTSYALRTHANVSSPVLIKSDLLPGNFERKLLVVNKRLYIFLLNVDLGQRLFYSVGLADNGSLDGTPRPEPIPSFPPDIDDGYEVYPVNLYSAHLFFLGGRIYLVAGFDIYSTVIYASKLSTNGEVVGWEEVGKGPLSQESTPILIRDSLYFLGGLSSFSGLIEDNGQINKWISRTALPSPLPYVAACLTKKHLIIAGGASGRTAVNKVYSIKIDENGQLTPPWVQQRDLPVGLSRASMKYIDGHIFVSGGIDGTNNPNKVIYSSNENLDGTLNEWSIFSRLESANTYATFAQFNGSHLFGDGSSLYRFATSKYCNNGIYYSKVIDLSSNRNISSISWNRVLSPANTSMPVSFSSGKTLSNSLESFTGISNGYSINKMDRYVQLRFKLNSGDGIATPGLDDFTITHFSDSTHPDGAPVLNVVNVTTSSLTVSLQDRSVGEEAFHFFLSRSSPPAGDPIQYASIVGSSGTTANYTFNELVHGTTYYLRARGWNAADSIDGAYSNLISIQTPSLDLKRRLSTEMLGIDSVVIGWPQVDNAIEYRVYDEANHLLATKSSSTLSYTESGISPNNRLFRRVEASDSIGVIQVGSVVLFTGLAAPLATDFTIEGQGENWISINVIPPLNASLGLSGTKIILRSEGMNVQTVRLKNIESTYRFESLPVGKKYQISVSYLNGDGIESMESPVLETFVGLASEIFAPAKEKFQISDGIDFPMDSNEPVQGTLKIYDSQQRKLREIPIDSPAGHSVVRWDGRDDSGNPVYSGIYWAVSETDHFGRKTFKVAGIR